MSRNQLSDEAMANIEKLKSELKHKASFKANDNVLFKDGKSFGRIDSLDGDYANVKHYDGDYTYSHLNELVRDSSPHDELVELGWAMTEYGDRFIKYSQTIERLHLIEIIIVRDRRTYYINHVNGSGVFEMDLVLAKILIRYMEEMKQ